MHSHPANVVTALSSAKVKMKFPDGSSRVVEIKSGDTLWSDGGTHEMENIGTTGDYGIIVELKK
jgi:hypothetical protein